MLCHRNLFTLMLAAILTVGLSQQAIASGTDKTEGIGVLLDISGSMKSYVNADDTKQFLKSLLLKSRPSASWNLSTSKSNDWLVKKLIDTDSAPLLSKGDQFLLMKFGELIYPTFPFFEPPMKFEYKRPSQIVDIIDAMVPGTATQQWTYITVGLATASEMFSKTERSSWYLFVLSDFDTDRDDKKPEGSPEQRTYEDQWKVGKKYSHEVVAVFRNNKNPSIQLQIFRVTKIKPIVIAPMSPPPVITPRLELLLPSDKNDKTNPTFSWIGVNLKNVKGYTLQVFDKRTKKQVAGTKSKIQNHTFSKEFEPGKYFWKVSAILKNGKTLGSRAKTFKVGGNSTDAPFILIILLGLTGAGFWKRREINDFTKSQIERFKS